jgi:ATP-dependent DNA helicase PIF1
MLAELIEAASLIIWDEAFMTHRNAFEALDRSLRDLLSLKSAQFVTIPFGGKVIVLGGDPRQILPVIEGGNRAQIINAAITNSPLWNSVTILHLTQNMRLHSTDLTDSEKTELADFSAWILNISNGCKENGPQAIWLIEFWCLMINTIRELISFLVFVFVVHRMQDLLGLRN